ncbi:hypothetical protein LCGC14_1816120 [marine sediment metagenome]|uniref:Restriction endonuclease type IV Mrr domain-containing protein n=1 Tax=marine sediment metagenome TaxID=412755 RepID=A0A0F9GKF7_9ZZZZ
MVSNVEKGKRVEKKARDALEELGWKILFKSIRTRFQSQDFAGLFDIVAARDRSRRLVSVKTFVSNARHVEHKRDLQNFSNKHSLLNEKCELWLWHQETSSTSSAGGTWEMITF